MLTLDLISVLFMISLVGLAGFTAFMMFLPVPWKFLDFMQTKQIAPDHMQYTLMIGGLIFINFLLSFVLEVIETTNAVIHV